VTTQRTVLLVEDDDSIRSLVRFNLELADYRVVEAKDGLEGLLLLDLHRPDAVVLDLMMPELDGAKVLAQLRADPEARGMPVIVITGKADISPVLHRLAGAGNLISKPFDPEALVGRLRELLPD
jgi:DNA-binding response OmpR family regulator